MDIHTIPHSQPTRQTLDYESGLRALRHTLWIGVYLSQHLRQTAVIARLMPVLSDLDRQLEELV
jgi:hypothetical protein